MTDIEAVKMSDEEMKRAVAIATEELASAWSPTCDCEHCQIARALLSAHALIEKQRAVVEASKAWHSAKCNRFPGCGDPNDGRFDGTHDWQCPVDTTESGLHDAVITLDTLASVGGEEGSK